MGLVKKLATIFLIAVLAANVTPVAYAQGPVNFANCRLGAGGVSSDVVGYNLEQLNLGLYLDWTSRNPPPAGLPSTIQYLQVIRVHQTKDDYGSGWFGPPRVYATPPSYKVSPSLSTIASRAASQPGSVWLVGNEIERVDWPQGSGWRGQDEITPELYATAYHDIHAVIKAADPTAKVGVGGIIQPTTLRLAYLDRMWNSYQAQYGHSMGQDIDLWNIHMFIIREVLNEWGAEIPAGFNNSDNDFTNNYNPADAFLGNSNYQTALNAHHNMTYYRQFLENFRAWMAAHGERNKVLLNTEFGILMALDNASVRNFLRNTFDYMFAATNSSTGHPYDENRLVQGWLWYSLNDNASPFQHGTLFNSSKSLTHVGNEWKNYVSDSNKPLASQPQRNLLVTNLRTVPNPASVPLGQTITVTLIADVANSGNTRTATNNQILVRFWDGPPHGPGSNIVASQTIADLPGCGSSATVPVDWSNRPAGDQTWYVEVVSIANETNAGDNVASSSFSVIAGQIRANLAVTKIVDNPAPSSGSIINYTLTATNSGPHTATDVKVNDLLPAGLVFNSYQATQGLYYPTGVWEVGALANQASAILTIKAQVIAGENGSPIVNSATITSTAPISDSNLANNTASVTIFPWAAPPNSLMYLPIILK